MEKRAGGLIYRPCTVVSEIGHESLVVGWSIEIAVVRPLEYHLKIE